MLIFDPINYSLKWTFLQDQIQFEGTLDHQVEIHQALNVLPVFPNNDHFIYVLTHGGNLIEQLVTDITPEVLEKLNSSIKFSPIPNTLTFSIVQNLPGKVPACLPPPVVRNRSVYSPSRNSTNLCPTLSFLY